LARAVAIERAVGNRQRGGVGVSDAAAAMGCTVAEEGAVGDAQISQVSDGAAVFTWCGSGVAREYAVGDCRPAEVVIEDAAAELGGGGVAREAAIGDRQRAVAERFIVDGAAVVSGVAREGAVGNGQIALVIDSAAKSRFGLYVARCGIA